MAQTGVQEILGAAILTALAFFILFWLLDRQCSRIQDKRPARMYQDAVERGLRERPRERYELPLSGPSRMDEIYYSQDYYDMHPFIYPTPYSFTTADFSIKRELRKKGDVYE